MPRSGGCDGFCKGARFYISMGLQSWQNLVLDSAGASKAYADRLMRGGSTIGGPAPPSAAGWLA
jgi:hypothetical protein